MMTAPNEEIESNGPTHGPGSVDPNVPRDEPAPPDDEYESAPQMHDFAADMDPDEAGRPAGEAGLFGDPRPNDTIYDEEDSEPELVRS
jgi:hypothetical protein